MPNVNLIHERQMVALRIEKRSRMLMLALSGVMAISVLAFFGLSIESDSVSKQTEHIKSELAKLEPYVKQIAATDKESNDLMPQLETLESAQTTCGKWEQVLTHFMSQTPKGSWLTSVRGNATDPNKAISLVVDGKGAQQNTVAEFMLRAQRSSVLENVSLRFTEEREDRDIKTINFEVGADLKDTTPPKPKEPAKPDGAKA